MPPYKIFDFHTLAFSKDDFAKIPKHHFGFMSASSLAANDQAFFMKIYVLSMRSRLQDPLLVDYAGIQSAMIQRSFIAKTYEYMRLFDKFNQRVIDSADVEFIPFMKMATKRVRSARKGEVWKLVEQIRDKMTHHYDLDHLDPVYTAKDFPAGHTFKIHMTEKTGNSLYVFAEEMFYLSQLYHDETEGITPQQVTDWLLESSKILIKLHQRYMLKVITTIFPDKFARARKLFIDDALLWETGDSLPLLHFGGATA